MPNAKSPPAASIGCSVKNVITVWPSLWVGIIQPFMSKAKIDISANSQVKICSKNQFNAHISQKALKVVYFPPL